MRIASRRCAGLLFWRCSGVWVLRLKLRILHHRLMWRVREIVAKRRICVALCSVFESPFLLTCSQRMSQAEAERQI